MKKRNGTNHFIERPIKICAVFALAACLAGCSAEEMMNDLFSRFSPLQPGESSSVAVSDELPANAGNTEGMVLDASGGLLILRAVQGDEYVFRMEGVRDLVEGGVQSGQYVRVWYSGTLEDTNARNVKLLQIEAAQETQPDTYDLGCMAEGVVVSFNELSITIRTAQGEEYRFVAGDSVRAMQNELHEGQWVRVHFDGTPESPVVSRVTESVRAADVFTVVGTLRGVDEEADTVTIQADSGGYYTFKKGDAEIVAPKGIWAGERRFVLSYRGTARPKETENALLLRMCAEENAELQTVQGVVCAVNENWGTADVCTANGRVLTFPVGLTILRSEEGAKVGTGVTITYSGCISDEYLHEVEIVSCAIRGQNTESSLLGTVKSVTAKSLRLAAADGREIVFSLPEGAYFPERMQRGDTVRVAYTGWIAGEDAENAVYVSASRAYD